MGKRPSKVTAALRAHDEQTPITRPVHGQSVFDEVMRSLQMHAPGLEPFRRIAIATDVAIKVRGFVDAANECPACPDYVGKCGKCGRPRPHANEALTRAG